MLTEPGAGTRNAVLLLSVVEHGMSPSEAQLPGVLSSPNTGSWRVTWARWRCWDWGCSLAVDQSYSSAVVQL